MKILFTTESYYPIIDGGAIAQHRIVHELIKRGHDVRVIAPNTQFRNTKEQDNGSVIYRSRGMLLPFYMNNKYHFPPFPLPFVQKVIKEFQPDIINVCSPYPNSLSALTIAKKFNIPVVGSIHILPENILAPWLHSAYYSLIKKYTWRFLIWFYNKVDWATVPTKTGGDLYKEQGLTTNVTPISNGVDTSMFHPKNKGAYLKEQFHLPDKPIVLYTGRINQEKNLDVLISAIPEVIKTCDAHFLFVGSGGYKDSIIQQTQDLSVAEHTTFIDFLPWEDYPNIYSVADVFIMPAEAELQSIVTLEAIASGLPAVVVNKGAVPELVTNNNGYTFEPGNSQQLAQHLITILNDKTVQKTMKINSINLAQSHAMDQVGLHYEQVYQKVIEKGVNR